MRKATRKHLIGIRIKELRKSKGLTQEQLSEKVDIDSKHLSRIEVGSSYPSMETLDKISKVLDVELKDMFEFHHHKDVDINKSISTLLKDATPEKLRLPTFSFVSWVISSGLQQSQYWIMSISSKCYFSALPLIITLSS